MVARAFSQREIEIFLLCDARRAQPWWGTEQSGALVFEYCSFTIMDSTALHVAWNRMCELRNLILKT